MKDIPEIYKVYLRFSVWPTGVSGGKRRDAELMFKVASKKNMTSYLKKMKDK